MERIIPEINRNWIVINFNMADRESEDDGLPSVIKKFNSYLGDFFSQSVHLSTIDKSVAAYNLKKGFSEENRQSLLKTIRGFEQIEYVYPALDLDDEIWFNLDKIEIAWKSNLTSRQKKRILDRYQAKTYKDGLKENTEQVRIDVSNISVWKAANLLAEDIRVRYAKPMLFRLQQPIACNLSLGINGANLGTPIPFELKIAFSQGINIQPSSILNLRLRPYELSPELFAVEYDKPLSSIELKESPVMASGNLYLYATGGFSIPKISVLYSAGNDDQLQSVQTEEIPINISSLIPAQAGNYQLKTANISQELGFDGKLDIISNQQFWLKSSVIPVSSLIFMLSIAWLIYIFLNREQKKLSLQSREKSFQQFRYSIEQWFYKDPADITTFELARIGECLRDYVLSFYQIPEALRGGSCAVFLRNIESYLPREVVKGLVRVLSLIEEAVVREEVGPEEVEKCFRQGRSLLQKIEESQR